MSGLRSATRALIYRGRYFTGDDPYFWYFAVPLRTDWPRNWHCGRRQTWREAMAEVDHVRRTSWRSI